MSFILSPLVLFISGLILAYIRSRKFLSAQLIRNLSYLIILSFIITNSLLYLDIVRWPLNYDFRPIAGSVWMFHTELTGIYKSQTIGNLSNIPADIKIQFVISGGWAFIFLLVYPVWLWSGFFIAQKYFFKQKIRVIRGLKSITDVKSRDRVDIADHKVIVKRNSNGMLALEDGLADLDNLATILKPNDKVIIKVTISNGNPWIKGSFTNPELVGLISQKISKITGVRVKIVDTNGIWTDFNRVAKIQGWYQMAREFEFDLINLSETEVVKFDFGSETVLKTQLIPTLLLHADYIISMPVMKTNLATKVSLSLKNMFDCLIHSELFPLDVDDAIVDFVRALPPSLTIIDGTIGGEAIGPLMVKSVLGESIIISKDAVAADSIASQIIGCNIHEIPFIRKATIEGLGTATLLQGGFEELDYTLPSDGIWDQPSNEISVFYKKLLLLINNSNIDKVLRASIEYLKNDQNSLSLFKDLSNAKTLILADAVTALVKLTSRYNYDEEFIEDLDLKIGERIFPEIGQEQWSTIHVKKSLEKIGLLGKSIFEYPKIFPSFVEIKDPDEKAAFAEKFLPTVNTVGLELLAENNSPSWGEFQYNLLESKGGSLRVLQVLLFWTKQRFVFSYFYNILLPLLLGIYGLVLVSGVNNESQLEGIISVLLVSGILWILGGPLLIRFIILYRNNKELIIRNPMFFPIYGTLFLITLYDIFDKFNRGVSKITTFQMFGNEISIYFPLVSILLFSLILFTVILIVLFGAKSFLASHDMDYGPIFVYLNRKEYGIEANLTDPNNWEIESINYDVYHYEMGSNSMGELIHFNALDKSNSHVNLEIDNNWHSFHLSSSTHNYLAFLGILISFGALIGMLLSVIFFWDEKSLLVLILTLEFILLLIGIMFIVARYRSTLVQVGKTHTRESLINPKHILTSNKLQILWNLRNEPARLKIQQKFIEPFNFEQDWKHWSDFGKEKEIFDESLTINTKNKITNLIFMSFWILGLIGAFIYSGNINLNSNLFIITISVVIFGVIVSIFLVDYTLRELIFFTFSVSFFAVIEELLLQEIGFGKLQGNSLFIIVFGWPVILFFALSLALAGNQLFHYDIKPHDNTKNRVLLILINVLGLYSFVLLPKVRNLLIEEPLGVFGFLLIVIFTILGISYILTTPLSHTLPLSFVIFFTTTLIEIIGNLSGIWTYITNSESPSFGLGYFANEFPIFLGFLWIFRISSLFIIFRLLDLDFIVRDQRK